ncbi:uncharacterized protein N7473_011639 [Penicillium subrubescens]|uniref:Uncharacterized protein n=1 Tax=Penicillium subrubescens TaxID=1316194 RepID=A0A1Q5TMK1_9EURO|nr:uncharacterized protein N7473_011639 [Penicillium subrubescens]KAJ5880586.1 hypothetical protein N7473_011639 [Penicillium subrubescens]OKP01438.1 hypothetical protein PENSUB_7428 [Penicillium subrubescens]
MAPTPTVSRFTAHTSTLAKRGVSIDGWRGTLIKTCIVLAALFVFFRLLAWLFCKRQKQARESYPWSMLHDHWYRADQKWRKAHGKKWWWPLVNKKVPKDLGPRPRMIIPLASSEDSPVDLEIENVDIPGLPPMALVRLPRL